MIESKRDVMADVIETWLQSTNLGLMVRGHRRDGDRGNIDFLRPPGLVCQATFLESFNGPTPRQKTCLSKAVCQAAETLLFCDDLATLVLMSDGKDSCLADPCLLSFQLEQRRDYPAKPTRQSNPAGKRCVYSI